jgi:hypothetical protein
MRDARLHRRTIDPGRAGETAIVAPKLWLASGSEYMRARERWRDGAAAVFPRGTYWLQRFASVPVVET